MVILGIDPGYAIVGFGVIDYDGYNYQVIDYGVIESSKDEAMPVRMAIVYNGVSELIEKYKPDCMAVEELFWNTNQTTGIRVSQARGVILLCATQNNVKIAEYTPLQVKQAVVGYGRAEKKQVITMVTMLLGLSAPPKPDDTADALAIAICHAHCGGSRLAQYYNQKNLK